MSELAKNLSITALMLVVETLAAKELYDINRTTENFEFLCEKRGKLETYIAELEAEQARWVMVSERLPNISGWYLACLIGWAGGYYTTELYFDTETGLPWRSSVRDEVYCWLDGVPEMPNPPEVQQ